jgi:hypothetical protein
MIYCKQHQPKFQNGISEQCKRVLKGNSGLLEPLGSFERAEKDHGNHVRRGRRSGQKWETEVPVPVRQRRR